MSGTTDHVAGMFHEVDMFLWFTDHGLSPYWAVADLCLDHFDGYGEVDFQLDDGDWHVYLAYNRDTGIAAREQDAVDGKMYEFKVHAEGPGEKKADFDLSPRWDDQRKPDGDLMSRPWVGGEGLDVHTQGANLTFQEYIYILQRSLQALASKAGTNINPQYFNRPLPQSNIATVELYVRLKREYSKKLVRKSGVFFKLMHLLAEEKGVEWVYSADNTDIVGKRHAFDLDPAASSKLGPDHQYGKRLKNYHPKHVRSEETEDDPLSSPKLGVALHKSLNDGAEQWANRDNLLRELEETLVNVLEWSGVPIAPDPTVYVEDDHFEPQASDRDVAILEDPTPDIEARQDNIVTTVLRDLTPSAAALAEVMATDGGRVPYEEVAEKTGYSISQIYRAIEELGDEVVKNDNGMLEFYSEHIRQQIEAVAEHLTREVVAAGNRVAKLAKRETRSAADSALQKWMDKYGAEFERVDGDSGRIRFDTVLSTIDSHSVPNIHDVLQEGLEAWSRAGRDYMQFVRFRFTADEVKMGPDQDKVGQFVTY